MTRSCARRAAMLAVLLGPAWFSGPALAYTVYVSNEKDDTITVIDSKSLQVTRTVKVGRRPRGVILSKDGKFLYVCASDDNGI
ncbi:MAG: beta-propeller fold lactonase family protein, partial [Microvirga sp.]